MEELEGSEHVDVHVMVPKLGQNENPNDKTLGATAGAYSNEFRYEEESIGICDSGFSNSRFYSNEGFKNLEISAHEIEETGSEGVDVVVPNRELSEKCISLFVDVFGPPNETAIGDEQVSTGNLERERSSNHDEQEKPNTIVSKNEKDVDLSDEDKFFMGDVVWVQTTTNSWWPGQIIDPSYVSNVAYKSDQNASFLVKYIGKYPSVWCSPIWCSYIQLKPFAENFEQMSLLKKSRIFPGAVAKAVDEFGRRIKAQMTCSCENRDVKETNYFLDKNVVAQFEPVNFLQLVKTLAWNKSKMGVLEVVKLHNHLSAFYHSLGHHQLPINQLCDMTDDDKHSDKKGMNLRPEDLIGSEKGFERDRKRSKYLSFPYVDATNDAEAPKVKSTAKKFHNKRPWKPTYNPIPEIKPGDLDTPSVDLLTKLRFMALGYVLHSEKSDFDSVDRFFNGFKRWAFHKHENGEKSKDEFKPLTIDSYSVITPKRKRRKKEEISARSDTKTALTSSVFNGNGTSGSFVINFGNPGSFGPENISMPNKRKGRAKNFLERMQGEIEVVLPDLNGNCTIQSLVVDSLANNITTPVNTQVPSNSEKKLGPWSITNSGFSEMHVSAENGSFLKTPKVNAVTLTNREKIKSELMTGRLDDGDKLKDSYLVTDAWLNGFLGPADNIPGVKKRNRKVKTPKMEGQSTTIPDLNGNAYIAETNSQAKVLPEVNSAPIEAKPPKKRIRRRKIVSPRAGLDPCFAKVLMSGESLGTALVLTFVDGFPVPSKEILINTFCGFGPLNESETKDLSDNKSAQVVFRKGPDAVEALKGIEKSCPFGPVLVKCQLHHLSPVPRAIGLKPCELKATNIPEKKAPDLAYIRKNLEMMTSALEKGGDRLSAEVREKLENEVKGLLKKVNTMVGSTSSS